MTWMNQLIIAPILLPLLTAALMLMLGEKHRPLKARINLFSSMVGGQKGAIQAHQLNLEQRMETGAGAVPTGHGEQQGADANDPGEYQHHRRELVHHQHDAERHLPVARQVQPIRCPRPWC